MPLLRNWRKKLVTKSDDKKVPALRFKGFTDDWEQRKLGDMANILRGASPRPIKDKKWFDTNSRIGWIRISDVTSQNGRVYTLGQHLSKKGQEKTRVVSSQTLLLSIAASVGYPVITYVETGVHDGFVIFDKPKFNLDFMFFKLQSIQNIWNKYGQAGSQVNINSSIVANTSISIPNIEEQKRISILLKKIEENIYLQQRKLSLIETLKRSFLSDLFFKTSTNSVVITLKQVTSIRGGYAFKSKEFTENGYPIIKIANISNNGEIKGPYSYTNNFNKKYILTKNDIVLAMSGATTGKIAKLRSSKAFLQNQRIGYFCKTNNIDYNYLYYLLISDQFKKQLKRITIAGAQPNVSSSDIENFRFSVLSSKNKQKKISDFLNKLDTKIRITKKKITIFSQLKRSLLNNMFI